MAKVTDELIPTRTTLLHRLKNWQDQPSWQEFFDAYWKLIYGVAIKSGLNEAEAQDVVQETMISAAKHMPTFNYDRSAGSFKAWLLNMTRWRITDQFRKRAPLPLFDASDDTDIGVHMECQAAEPVSACFEALWDAEWETNILDVAIENVKRRVDPQNYQIYDFYVNKEWPPDKIAKNFGIPIGRVYLAKHRVIELITAEVAQLKKHLN